MAKMGGTHIFNCRIILLDGSEARANSQGNERLTHDQIRSLQQAGGRQWASMTAKLHSYENTERKKVEAGRKVSSRSHMHAAEIRNYIAQVKLE